MADKKPVAARREALRLCAGAAIAGFGSTSEGRADPLGTAGEGRADAVATPPPSAAGEETLDAALSLLHDTEPESRQGLSTHAPMVAEALCSLGRGERAVAWVETYRGPLLRLPVARQKIRREDWRAALGGRPESSSWEAALERWADWRELFHAELAEAPWTDVLDTWAGRLAPGLCAAATHGVIRTAHAARAMGRRETAVRRAELARGLAYWASAYQELPARPGTEAPANTYAHALDRLPLYTEAHAGVPTGNIVNGLREAGRLAGFANARDLVATPADVSAALSELTRTAARAYLRHGTQGRTVATIAFIHGVTGPTALRRIMPHVRPETARAALPYAWQAVAGIYAAYARRENPPREPGEAKRAPEELVTRAVANGDEHAIKFTEALLAEHSIRPDPAYLAAAEDVVERL
jgi:hypothetical protein